MALTWHYRKNEFLLWFWRHLDLSPLKLTNLSPRKTIYPITNQHNTLKKTLFLQTLNNQVLFFLQQSQIYIYRSFDLNFRREKNNGKIIHIIKTIMEVI